MMDLNKKTVEKLSPDTVWKINKLLDMLSAELSLTPNTSIPVIFNCNLETYQDLFSYESAQRGLPHYIHYIKESIQLNIVSNLEYGSYYLQFPYSIYSGLRSSKTYKWNKIKAITDQLNDLSA